MPHAAFRHTATVAASPASIWSALQSAETWGGIGLIESVSNEQRDDTGHLESFDFTTSVGGRTWEGTARSVSSTPGEHIELIMSTREIRGRIGIDLTTESDRCLVTVRLEVEPAGMLATLFWSVVGKAIASGFPRQVDEFAAGFGR